MQLFIHEVGRKGAARDFPKTIEKEISIDDIKRYAPTHLRDEIVSELEKAFPSGSLHAWGVPEGAASTIRQLAIGDVMLLIRTISEDGDIPYMCNVRSIWKEKMEDLSNALWGSYHFPYVFFCSVNKIDLTWTKFKEDVSYEPIYRPGGYVVRVNKKRFNKYGGEATYVAKLLNSNSLYLTAKGEKKVEISSDTLVAIYFEVGKVYHRQRDIHALYGGQDQGGMSTPARYPDIFLFTGEVGKIYGYKDGFRPDGVFYYTGEGQKGDMKMSNSNKALRDHASLGKRVHLFETSKEIGKGYARYMGQAFCLGHHKEERVDIDGKLRMAIVFELDVDTSDEEETIFSMQEPFVQYSSVSKKSGKLLGELRKKAVEKASKDATPQQKRQNVFVRSKAIKDYVLKRANGVCEGCGNKAPFITKKQEPYLEPHHTTRIADGGPDHPEHVIALCPSCHRRAHYAIDAQEYNHKLIDKLKIIEV
ncbi:HNH endonuclease [Hymenobacter chitinivorans]|uniref:HNH endonuclease n=1 Tax=Hymenobacter chitinivorans DSM 11115 TaxID=1121954 RepID=A0A2M9BPJ3_9BACT|nr:HNH endonuclease signature motif containing protein [Hymenobacter chitinivorans]PJJ59850.1 HNH endonuclease [Hymenobacter chitinivorans DSM 11115]